MPFEDQTHAQNEHSDVEITFLLSSVVFIDSTHEDVEHPPIYFLDRLSMVSCILVVEFIPQQPIYLESFESCEGLGRVAVMDSNQLVMLGKVMSVKYKPFGKK